MKAVTRALVVIAFVLGLSSQADAATSSILVESSTSATVNLDTAFGHSLEVGPFGAPVLSNVDRTFTGTVGDAFVDSFTFTVDAIADSTVALLSFNIAPILGLTNTALELFDITGGGSTLLGSASGTGTLVLQVFGLDPTSNYEIRVAAELTESSGRYDLAIALAAVPLPAALLLFASALVALVGFSGLATRKRAT